MLLIKLVIYLYYAIKLYFKLTISFSYTINYNLEKFIYFSTSYTFS